MCGLVGAIAKTTSGFWSTDGDIFKEMLYCDVLRGRDATGVYGVTKNGNVAYAKQATPGGWFISSAEYKDWEKRINPDFHVMVGHNRKATHGDKKDKDAHPFVNKRIVLVHNGMIRNHKDFCKDSTVDSNAIANALETRDYKDVLKEVNGAFAFIWYDLENKLLHFVRNKDRPLSIIETERSWYMASEGMMAHWIASRNNQNVLSATLIPEGVVHTIEIQQDKPKFIETEKVELYTPKTYVYSGTSGGSTYQAPKSHGRSGGIAGSIGKDTSTLFLDKETVIRPVQEWLAKGDLVSLELVEYSDFTKAHYADTHETVTLQAKVLNCDLEGPTFYANVPIALAKELVEGTNVFTATVRAINYGALNKVRVYVDEVEVNDVQETENGIFITNLQFASDDFINHCDKCMKLVGWKNLDEMRITYRYHYTDFVDVNIICPACHTKEKNQNASSTSALQNVESELQEVARRAEETASQIASRSLEEGLTGYYGTFD